MINLTDTIYTIKQKIRSLEINEEEQIKKIQEKFEEDKLKYINALNVNMELNEACLECSGRGTVGFLDAAGSRDYDTCKVCGGNKMKR